MGSVDEHVLRHCLRFDVTCDLPGRLRLMFPRYGLLPR